MIGNQRKDDFGVVLDLNEIGIYVQRCAVSFETLCLINFIIIITINYYY